MERQTVKLAMGQMRVMPGRPETNIEGAIRMIEDAGGKGARVIVLPECLDLGWTHPSAREMAEPIPGVRSNALCAAAKETGIHVVAGLTERAGQRIYNSAVLISPEGELLAKHRKINVLTMAQDLYATGESLRVVETPLGTIGVDICADNFPTSLALGHSLARMGAQMILSPSAWAVDPDHDNEKTPYGQMWRDAYTTLARLYDIGVVGVSYVGWMEAGAWEKGKCIGCSLAVAPGGEILAQGTYGESAEELLFVDMPVVRCAVTGTDIYGMLKGRGYEGP